MRERTEMAELQSRFARASMASDLAESARRTTSIERHRRDRLLYSGSYPQADPSRVTFGRSSAASGRGGPQWAHADPVTIRTLRRLCQAMVRTNCMASALVGAMQDLVVGAGPQLRAQTTNNGFNTLAETLWHDYAFGDGELCGCRIDAAGLGSVATRLRQIVADGLTDGASLDIALDNGSIQSIETERLVSVPRATLLRLAAGEDLNAPAARPGMGAGMGAGMGLLSPWTGVDSDWVSADGGCVGGMVLDPYGAVEAYVVGSYTGSSASAMYAGTLVHDVTAAGAQLVDARAALYVPSWIAARTNLYRPEPALAGVLSRLEQLEALSDSVRGTFYISTLFGIIMTSKNAGQMQAAAPGSLESRDASDPVATASPFQHAVAMEPGMIRWAEQGDQAFQVKPEHPSQQYESYVLTELTQVGAHVGCPILLALGDPRQTNYSGFRAMLSLAWQRFKTCRAEIERRWLARVYARFIRRMIDEGRLVDVPGAETQASWTWPPMPVLDPVAEIDAQSRAVASNLRSRRNAMRQLDGTDFDDELPQMANEAERMRSAGLTPMYSGIAAAAGGAGDGGGAGAAGGSAGGDNVDAGGTPAPPKDSGAAPTKADRPGDQRP